MGGKEGGRGGEREEEGGDGGGERGGGRGEGRNQIEEASPIRGCFTLLLVKEASTLGLMLKCFRKNLVQCVFLQKKIFCF